MKIYMTKQENEAF